MEHLAPEDLVEDWSDLSNRSLAAGARLGRYELLLPIAHGGMARVWAARQSGQRGFTKLVAIKTILPHLAHSTEFERMFLDEARIASRVHHPNVTEIYELGEEGSVLYLAMEWVNGESLVHVIRGLGAKGAQGLDLRLAARIVADACAGVHAAHELTDDDGRLLNVVHRDVSPHNILVSLEGTVKVTDFGVARALGQSHEATSAGQVKGKVAYMAPEIIGGQPFDRRSDLFAMGCVLYEATTGVQPFRGAGDPQIMQTVLRGVYEKPASLVAGYPPELGAIVDRALLQDARQRYPNAEQMRIALEEWLARSGPVVTPSQVGALVRQRLGPHLDKRREHVRAAMAVQHDTVPTVPVDRAPTGGRPAASAATPARRDEGNGSHSGVVATSPEVPRARVSSPRIGAALPPVTTPPRAPSRAAASPVAAAVATQPSRPPPTSGRYASAVVLGVGFAMLVGGIALVGWVLTGSRTAANPPAPSTQPAVTSIATQAPPTPTPSAKPAASHVGARGAGTASASSSTSPGTVDINDLPTARPTWWGTAPAVAAPKPSTAKSPDLPANPY